MTRPRGRLALFFGRALTAAVLLPVVVLLVWFGGWPLLAALCVAGGIALREFYLACDKGHKPLHCVGYIGTVALFAVLHVAPQMFLPAVLCVVAIAQILFGIFFKTHTVASLAVTVYGFLYVPVMVSFIYLLRAREAGSPYFVWLMLICAFGCDTFAYLAGQLFGKHKLVGSASLSKTLEGLIGGCVGAVGLGVLFAWVMGLFLREPASPQWLLVVAGISFVGAVFAILGDMSASAIKRSAGIKDFSGALRGHGGIMDRADSLILVAPAMFFIAVLLL